MKSLVFMFITVTLLATNSTLAGAQFAEPTALSNAVRSSTVTPAKSSDRGCLALEVITTGAIGAVVGGALGLAPAAVVALLGQPRVAGGIVIGTAAFGAFVFGTGRYLIGGCTTRLNKPKSETTNDRSPTDSLPEFRDLPMSRDSSTTPR